MAEFRTYGRPRRRARVAAPRLFGLATAFTDKYFSDDESPKALRSAPDPFDLLLMEEIQKSKPVVDSVSAQLTPNPANNLSDTSQSSISPVIEKPKPTPLKLPKHKYKMRNIKKKTIPVKTIEENFDYSNYNLIVEPIRKTDIYNPNEDLFYFSQKSSQHLEKHENDLKNLSDFIIKEVFDENVTSKNNKIKDSTSSLHQKFSADNSIHFDVEKGSLISSTPHKTEHYNISAHENDISAISFSHNSKCNTLSKENYKSAIKFSDRPKCNTHSKENYISTTIFLDNSNCNVSNCKNDLSVKSFPQNHVLTSNFVTPMSQSFNCRKDATSTSESSSSRNSPDIFGESCKIVNSFKKNESDNLLRNKNVENMIMHQVPDANCSSKDISRNIYSLVEDKIESSISTIEDSLKLENINRNNHECRKNEISALKNSRSEFTKDFLEKSYSNCKSKTIRNSSFEKSYSFSNKPLNFKNDSQLISEPNYSDLSVVLENISSNVLSFNEKEHNFETLQSEDSSPKNISRNIYSPVKDEIESSSITIEDSFELEYINRNNHECRKNEISALNNSHSEFTKDFLEKSYSNCKSKTIKNSCFEKSLNFINISQLISESNYSDSSVLLENISSNILDFNEKEHNFETMQSEDSSPIFSDLVNTMSYNPTRFIAHNKVRHIFNKSMYASELVNKTILEDKSFETTPFKDTEKSTFQQLINCGTITERKKKPIIDHSFESDISSETFVKPDINITLLPGKRWERSLNIIRNLNFTNTTLDQLDFTVKDDTCTKGRKYKECVEKINQLQNKSVLQDSVYLSNTILQSRHRKSVVRIIKDRKLESELLHDPGNDTEISLLLSRVSRSGFEVDGTLIDWGDARDEEDARNIVLRKCNQIEPLPFNECYPNWKLRHCQKIGEGVFGEVYLFRNEEDLRNPIVMKVIPIEGERLVNDQYQKKFKEIVSEIIAATELSNLRNNSYHNTISFNKVHRVRCTKGPYPERLQELWISYDELKGSENDYPDFDSDQLYIVLEFENGGSDLEAFKFANAKQAYALFFQLAFALATAEDALQFEHRDLHWGNVLVKPTDDEYVDFVIGGVSYSVPTCGLFGNIIDFTLSRISVPQVALTIYNDLACDDDLFIADGDYQFEIYRMMRDKVKNSWDVFEPHTNVMWLHYMLKKMVNGFHYTKKTTKVHKQYLGKLQKLACKMLNYKSCLDFVKCEQCEIPYNKNM